MTRNHIALSRDYQRLVVVPATANFLASAATGGARNGVELMLIAMPTPSVIVPAMNSVMWSKPAIQRNILALKEDGHTVLAPQEREVYEAASKGFRSGVAASTPYEVANAVREISDATAGS
jgi:phosphopantothenoylcysteine decarboxylase/phosphopantothenate--cysteine ligase